MSSTTVWMLVGFLGQTCFSCRFLLQWLASERQDKSIIPVAFWYFSLAGGTVLLMYAIARRDPVFITGQASGLIIYLRNLHLIKNEKHAS